MPLQYEKEELYGRALFSITNGDQSVHVAFEPAPGDAYMMIIFAEQGQEIIEPHNEELWDVLYDVLADFDEGRKLDYEIIAT